MTTLTMNAYDSPPAECLQALSDGLAREAVQQRNVDPIQPFGLFLQDAETVYAGITGFSLYGCLHIDMLWVAESHRNQGFGSQLIEQAKELGRKRGCTFTTVSTMDWEARAFYEKRGFETEFVRQGYQNQSQMIFLRKDL